MAGKAGGAGVVGFAVAIIVGVILISYAAGYLLGRLILG
jgi:hypothetical protein